MVEIYIDRKGDKNLPEKITTETDSNFFKEGEVIDFPSLSNKTGNYTAIKVIDTTKQIVTEITGNKVKIVVHAERCF